MARDIDWKLRLTAAVLGAPTRKDLAAAFRRVNPKTSFDVGRADKWLQGRAQPRQAQIYDDWRKVLGLTRTSKWIADCDIDAFIDEVCARHGRDPADLRRMADEASSSSLSRMPGPDLSGTYVAYAHSWSPYFAGRLTRGVFTVSPRIGASKVKASYLEALPTGPMKLAGTGSLSKNDLRFDLSDSSGVAQLLTFCLFPPTPPASVLAGMMFGTPLLGPEARPSMSRIVMIRHSAPPPELATVDAYLPERPSLVDDLRTMGFSIADPRDVERHLDEFLNGGYRAGLDQVPIESYRNLVGFFDRAWLSGRR